MEKQVFSFIEQNSMIEPGDTVYAAVSGGADSVCLLGILLACRGRFGFNLKTVHVEHGIRGKESLEDAAFVQALCDRENIPVTVITVDAPAYAAEKGLSLEEAARKLRYDAFECCIRSERQKRVLVALAHNREDQAETVLFHLARGSGLKGLAGMQPVRGPYIRPLLCTSRAQIEEYLTSRGLKWRTDSTNLSDVHTRNRIRSRLLPLMEEEVNAKAVAHICETAAQAAEADAYLRSRAARILQTLIKPPAARPDGYPECPVRFVLRLDADGLRRQPSLMQAYILQEAIRIVLRDASLYNMGRAHIRALQELAAAGKTGHADFPGGLAADYAGGELALCLCPPEYTADYAAGTAAGPDTVVISGDGEYRFGEYVFSVRFMSRQELLSSGEDYRAQNRYTKWIACDKIKGTVCLRRRMNGDRIVINAQGGRRKLKDYLIDEKIPAPDRDRLVLLSDDETVLWVVGMRIGENAKITEETGQIMRISCGTDRTGD